LGVAAAVSVHNGRATPGQQCAGSRHERRFVDVDQFVPLRVVRRRVQVGPWVRTGGTAGTGWSGLPTILAETYVGERGGLLSLGVREGDTNTSSLSPGIVVDSG